MSSEELGDHVHREVLKQHIQNGNINRNQQRVRSLIPGSEELGKIREAVYT